MGKKIKRYHYVPLLDDANINDQGLDALGVVGEFECVLVVSMADGTIPKLGAYRQDGTTIVGNKVYVTGRNTTAALASDAVRDKMINFGNQITAAGGLGLTLTLDDAGFSKMVTDVVGSAYKLGYRFTDKAGVTVASAPALDTSYVSGAGNLYGSSKDIGTITGKFPTLSETGGRVNRVGFTRVELEGTFKKYGFFDEYTQESLDFDSDSELEMHINREMIFGANEIVEDLLQLDLLNAAGVVYYAGGATGVAALSGVAASLTEVTYADLSRLSTELDNNRCPKRKSVV